MAEYLFLVYQSADLQHCNSYNVVSTFEYPPLYIHRECDSITSPHKIKMDKVYPHSQGGTCCVLFTAVEHLNYFFSFG